MRIALIHDIRHLRTRFRVDGIDVMSRGISGGKQVKKFVNGINRGLFVYSVTMGRRYYSCKIYSSRLETFLRHFFITVRTSTGATASGKETMITSSHYLL